MLHHGLLNIVFSSPWLQLSKRIKENKYYKTIKIVIKDWWKELWPDTFTPITYAKIVLFGNNLLQNDKQGI